MNQLTLFGSHGGIFFGVIAFVLIIFFLGREVMTWYWKINRIEELLEEIAENTRPPENKKVITKDTQVYKGEKVYRDLADNPVDIHGNPILEEKD
jgi:hypothetical protein